MPDREPRLHYLILPLAALIVLIPLVRHGCSCGHDFDFHILNWFEAARQFTHGTLHPHWAYTPAWNAGEPRFIFYPPISWIIGALLGLIMPWTWTPIAYTWLALTAAGFALYHLARSVTTPNAALLTATFYIVNPYMLFTAYERTAYAELLAAAWIPLLLHAILREQVTIPRIAIPVALLWLTNAPAAVMSCYTLALLTTIRIVTNPGAPSFASFAKGGVSRESATAPAHLSATKPLTSIQLALRTTAGTILGLALAAFYILPAAYERRYVQIAMAILSGLHPQDNFLFHRTSDPDHDTVLYTASTVAIILIALTAITLAVNLLNRHKAKNSTKQAILPLTVLTLTIALLLTPLSAPIWHYLPELRFLQFPWRLLAILAPTLSLAIALPLSHFKLKPLPTAALSLTIAASLTWPAYHAFHQRCYPEDTVPARLTLFHSANPGTEPTDEYTPTNADNDSLAHTDPAYWLSPDPNAKAPASTSPGPAPTHLTVNAPAPEDIILNLRDYPAWRITLNGTPITDHVQRDDGLIALPIPAGPSTIDIHYAQTLDQTLGDIFSLTSLALLLLLLARSRRKTARSRRKTV